MALRKTGRLPSTVPKSTVRTGYGRTVRHIQFTELRARVVSAPVSYSRRFRHRILAQIRGILRLFHGKLFLTPSGEFFLRTGISFMASDSNPLAYILLQVFLVTFSLFRGKKRHDEASIRGNVSQPVIICFEPRLKGIPIDLCVKQSDINSY